jgi:hypothetical protein
MMVVMIPFMISTTDATKLLTPLTMSDMVSGCGSGSGDWKF